MEFVQNVSHELRTPLTSIKGWSETLSYEGITRDELDLGLGIIQDETERLINLVEELLDFSRLASDRIKLKIDTLDVIKLVIGVVNQLKVKSSEKDIKLNVEFEVVYEDENILLVNKPAGLLVHEGDQWCADTLIARIQHYLYKKGEYDPKNENSFVPALCNRIDRNTGGIVVAAKTAEALRVMNEKIKNDEISKFYYCVVHGKMPKKADTLTGFLLKDSDKNQVKIFDKQVKGSKNIITKYKVIAKAKDTALLEVELLTGRTHQIRAHFAYIGHPLAGDTKYGTNKQNQHLNYKHQALYSYKLRFCFKGEPTVLDYLNGKEFSIPKSDIYFTQEFFRK